MPRSDSGAARGTVQLMVGTELGALPANVSVNARAMVTAGVFILRCMRPPSTGLSVPTTPAIPNLAGLVFVEPTKKLFAGSPRDRSFGALSDLGSGSGSTRLGRATAVARVRVDPGR
jgi:hypothetical protein